MERESREETFRLPGAFDIVAIAASAGGLAAIRRVLSSLPLEFPAAVIVVQHLDPHHRSLLAPILARHTPLRVKEAEQGEHIASGTVFIAPPDRHLLVNAGGFLALSRSELVHFVRPSADLLFESVATNFRDRAIAVVLTGSGTDGRMGVQAIKKMGGIVLVQDIATSEFDGMPLAAAQTGAADWILPLEKIAPYLIELVSGQKYRR